MKRIIYYLTLALLLSYNTNADVPLAERNALIDLYNATNGSSWTTNTHWNSDTIVSVWYGITVVDDHVVAIHLPNNELDGTLPSSLENLEYLEYLNLSDNSLEGTIPEEVWNLGTLKTIVLNNK